MVLMHHMMFRLLGDCGACSTQSVSTRVEVSFPRACQFSEYIRKEASASREVGPWGGYPPKVSVCHTS